MSCGLPFLPGAALMLEPWASRPALDLRRIGVVTVVLALPVAWAQAQPNFGRECASWVVDGVSSPPCTTDEVLHFHAPSFLGLAALGGAGLVGWSAGGRKDAPWALPAGVGAVPAVLLVGAGPAHFAALVVALFLLRLVWRSLRPGATHKPLST